MAAQGPARGNVGWAILAVALAVPGFLFYNWWSHLKADQAKAVAAKAHSRVEGGVFQTPTTASRLVNPIASSSAPAISGAAAPGASPAAAGQPMKAPGAPPFPSSPGGATASAPATAVAPAPSPMATSSAPAPGASSAAGAIVSTVTITLSRDPMMSPMDLVRIREDEIRKLEEAERIRREAEEARRPHPKEKARVVKEKPIEKFIELQGIVATPDGATLAIVNGSTVNEGESFVVEGHAAKVKVLRISSSEVTFEYKARKFKMSVNAE